MWILTFLSREFCQGWHVSIYSTWPGTFRALDGDIEAGMAKRVNWV